ncbi:DoxX family protein [Magnetovibrio sp.]|uniref:DoxX family protein n=1 Tax=Magnetovibrio sp. TaxID=2024836 RepID=UPI002F946866
MPALSGLYCRAVQRLKAIPDGLMVLMARVGLGAFFVRAGQTKVDGDFNLTDTTLYLFREEYKVPLLSPEVAAYTATAAEHVLGALLIVGLATRLSALGLLGMTLVIQVFVYPGSWPDHLLWAAVLMFILARGPGWLAADRGLCKITGHTCAVSPQP